jgi:acetoacetyl-CoA reductase
MARVAVVTGGTRGIGHAISEALAKKGYRVAATYAGNDEAARLFQIQTGIPIYKFDVGDYTACEYAVKRIAHDLGPVDILVNNAGITKDGFLHRMTKDNWDAVIRTNLDSVFNMTRLVIESMRARAFGRIISISSINGRKGQLGQANYSAAKAGLLGFTKAVALEGAAKNITCNVIAPGYINTEMVAAVPKDVLETKILPLIPVGRLGTTEEIARCVVFLAADDAGFITGACLDANGGQYMAS